MFGFNNRRRKTLIDKKDPSSKVDSNWKFRETWEDYPAPDYKAIHTYCEVALADSDNVLYYRTRNPNLKVGDLVYVPLGYKYEKKIGTILSMRDYTGYRAPYPLEKTKHIIGKVEQTPPTADT